ncbi:hypothetical protein C480_21664 [Natrialba aegyptia DSM 13077]|uniref:Uncharacterized protein n=1 Tax=Natrialba aegyptia DSM 13077 TaxID=1227491 RepID=M0AIU2_9EURY|nr:hypothetical protein C480_21664 [Natrialba aegyptia DSM 13077]
MVRSINEKHGLIDVVFLTKLSQKPLEQCRRSRCKEHQMQEFVRFGIDSSVQPELLAVDSDHRLVERDVIRAPVASGL